MQLFAESLGYKHSVLTYKMTFILKQFCVFFILSIRHHSFFACSGLGLELGLKLGLGLELRLGLRLGLGLG